MVKKCKCPFFFQFVNKEESYCKCSKEMQAHSRNLTYQWNMDPLMMYFLLNMGIFHCYISLPEGSSDSKYLQC